MAAIAIGDCTVTNDAALAGIMLVKVVTPATADDAMRASHWSAEPE